MSTADTTADLIMIAYDGSDNARRAVQYAGRFLQAFDRFDRRAVRLDREHQAGIERLVVHDHRAGAAIADVAALLRACQVQILA